MRVVGGTLRGRKIVAPPGATVRPTSDRVREAIFNVLFGIIDLDGASVIDLFAGSGALGIEAVSRGAASAVLVESDREALVSIRTNVSALGVEGRVRIVAADALGWLRPAASADVVFADPPYRFDAWPALLGNLNARVVVVESDRDIEPPPHLEVLKRKRYGTTVVTFMGAAEAGALSEGESKGDPT